MVGKLELMWGRVKDHMGGISWGIRRVGNQFTTQAIKSTTKLLGEMNRLIKASPTKIIKRQLESTGERAMRVLLGIIFLRPKTFTHIRVRV